MDGGPGQRERPSGDQRGADRREASNRASGSDRHSNPAGAVTRGDVTETDAAGTDGDGEAERSEASESASGSGRRERHASPEGDDEFDAGDDAQAESVADEMAAIRAHAESIRDEEVARALSQLAAQDELTPERREEIGRLADRIVERLLAVPAETLAAAADDEVAETARELFGD